MLNEELAEVVRMVTVLDDKVDNLTNRQKDLFEKLNRSIYRTERFLEKTETPKDIAATKN